MQKWFLAAVVAAGFALPAGYMAYADDGTGLGSLLTGRVNQSIGIPLTTDLVKVYRGQNGDPVYGLLSSIPFGGLASANTFTGAQTFGQILYTVTTQSGTTYTLAATDCGTQIDFTNAGAVTVTIPQTLPVGCNVAVLQAGATKVSVNGSAVTAATLHSAHSYTGTSGQWAIIGVNIEANAGGSAAIAILTGDGA
jgi:hypothetical protein